MDLAELSSRSGIPARRLRYVIDRGIVRVKVAAGRGSPRDLSPAESLAVALAALLIESGVRKPFARWVVEGMLGRSTADQSRLAALSRPPSPGAVLVVELADGVRNMRSRTSDDPGDPGFNPPWQQVGTRARLGEDYRPMVTVAIDAAQLRRRLFGDLPVDG